ncbi:DUF6998 domain-containing protein [Rhizobium sp. P28RR-XV]|uniref:DUF6998 domain-containing protein n=1 Tax=Rhizobium sp. P28RR-XV TaxID=2726737 RepID=UPI0014571C16|nr:hypothetical protein [Rhizobium sp. P28RR-XV]NLR88384.1 hypothetical protein [Rhizobium sp. P28RR-XV]
MTETEAARRVREILTTIKPLTAEYYHLTGKPLGVTSEVAEAVTAEALGLELVPARTAGYDAIRRDGNDHEERIQIKGRAFGADAKPGQRLGQIKQAAACDTVLLVLLDNATSDLREIWQAPYTVVAKRLALPGSKARERGARGVREFKRLAFKVWPIG